MTYITHQFDISHFLEEYKVLQSKDHDLLMQTLDQSGYIAGGFARFVARYFLYPELHSPIMIHSSDELYRECVFYRHFFRDCATSATSRYPSVPLLDIDVFFSDPARRDAILNNVKLSQSMLKFALNYDIPRSQISKFQFITKFCGQPEEVLSKFDIANAMVWIDKNSLNVAPGWSTLEEKRLLHLNHFNSDWVLQRLNKWKKKYNYNAFSPETCDLISTNFKELVDKLYVAQKEKPYINSIQFSRQQVTKRKLRDMVYTHIHDFSPSQLISFSGFLDDAQNENAYQKTFSSVVFSELSHRMIGNKSK